MRDAFVAGQLTVLAVTVFLGVFIAICFDLLAVFRHLSSCPAAVIAA